METDSAEEFTHQLGNWVKDAKELDFMKKQLAKGGIRVSRESLQPYTLRK